MEREGDLLDVKMCKEDLQRRKTTMYFELFQMYQKLTKHFFPSLRQHLSKYMDLEKVSRQVELLKFMQHRNSQKGERGLLVSNTTTAASRVLTEEENVVAFIMRKQARQQSYFGSQSQLYSRSNNKKGQQLYRSVSYSSVVVKEKNSTYIEKSCGNRRQIGNHNVTSLVLLHAVREKK